MHCQACYSVANADINTSENPGRTGRKRTCVAMSRPIEAWGEVVLHTLANHQGKRPTQGCDAGNDRGQSK